MITTGPNLRVCEIVKFPPCVGRIKQIVAVTHNYLFGEYDSGQSVMMSSSNEADLHEDSLDLDDDKPSRAHASDEGDTCVC